MLDNAVDLNLSHNKYCNSTHHFLPVSAWSNKAITRVLSGRSHLSSRGPELQPQWQQPFTLLKCPSAFYLIPTCSVVLTCALRLSVEGKWNMDFPVRIHRFIRNSPALLALSMVLKSRHTLHHDSTPHTNRSTFSVCEYAVGRSAEIKHSPRWRYAYQMNFYLSVLSTHSAVPKRNAQIK